MKAVIEVQMNNAAFEDDATVELARILRHLATDLENNYLARAIREQEDYNLRDINGNTVGKCRVEREKED